ncbi:MAG: BREX-1 system adenine-specific DNA-methyltransferase PglX [Candidatus Sulfotelmatobacter sp.]
MNQDIRNKLRNVVTHCRKLLEDSVSQELEGKYGIFARKDQVTADPNAKMPHLTEEEQAARKDILDHFGHVKARGFKPKESLDQLVREIAFTHLNRLCAYKMMEAREVYLGGQKFREAVSRGINSNGVKFYLADHPDEERLFNTGHQDVAYRHFLDWLGGLLSDEIGVLFNPNDPANRLYPRQKTLDEVLDLLNGGGIKPEEAELREEWPKIWSQDETLGWVYQYFTPKELRDVSRSESMVPRNSYELAFRNQFFTPRYVVEFLTDNTLGRIWYEMRKSDTALKNQCRYLVHRPSEIFLKEGEQPPKDAAEGRGDLSQEELLKLPVYILHRPKKDPRDLRILDPASGSGHFLLYCFDLLLTIYDEAYADTELGPALQKDYQKLEDLRRDVPRLILARNVYGIDIDLRASQIAALALWLRCQRAYQDMGLKKDRPTITRSNFVCAEPMPGEEQILREFVSQLEPKLLGQVVEVVFDKMKLAGEAGALLKIEEEIRGVLTAAKQQWVRETSQATDRKGQPLLFTQAAMDRLSGRPEQPSFFDLSDITDELFFEQAEARVIEALRLYAEKAHNGQHLQRRLFTDDAVRGFALVDLCHKHFDVALMNPPFGDPTPNCRPMLAAHYPISKPDLFAAFIDRASHLLTRDGCLGCISSRSGFYLPTLEKWRVESILDTNRLTLYVDLGIDVLDSAMVETAMYVLGPSDTSTIPLSINVMREELTNKNIRILEAKETVALGNMPANTFLFRCSSAHDIPGSPFCYWASPTALKVFARWRSLEASLGTAKQGLATTDDFRFLRCWYEVDPQWSGRSFANVESGKKWIPYSKGGEFAPYAADHHLYVNWEGDGQEIKSAVMADATTTHWSRRVAARDFYFRKGLTWSLRTDLLMLSPLPSGSIFGVSGMGCFAHSDDDDDLLFIAACASSSLIRYLSRILVGAQEMRPKYQAGIVQSLPLAEVDTGVKKHLILLQAENFRCGRELLALDETCLYFDGFKQLSSWTSFAGNAGFAAVVKEFVLKRVQIIAANQSKINDILFGLAAIPNAARSEIDNETSFVVPEPDCRGAALTHSVISYALGMCLGRWHATPFVGSPRKATPCFDALPVHPEAAAADGNTFDHKAIILVDDAEHADDIIRHLRDVFEFVWADRADAIENEACEILGVSELREYFRKPSKGGFWDDHASRYSKSRRRAPVYWLLQSSKKSYGLWLYYHRLDKDSLFKVLVNYVEPKIRMEASRLDAFRQQKAAAGDSGKEAKRLAKEVEQQEDFISELGDFEDKLRRAANLHLEPDLNDGVVLNIAPLHELVPWKEAKEYWEGLVAGKYEWSSIGKQLRQKGLVK